MPSSSLILYNYLASLVYIDTLFVHCGQVEYDVVYYCMQLSDYQTCSRKNKNEN